MGRLPKVFALVSIGGFDGGSPASQDEIVLSFNAAWLTLPPPTVRPEQSEDV